MKSQISLIVFLGLLSFGTCLAQNNRIISDKEVLDTAKANLNRFIESIDGSFKNFGFNSKEEMNKITLGPPYETVFLSSEFIKYPVFVDGKNYFTKENFIWEVPLIVDNTIRVFLRVLYSNDTLKYIGGGGSDFCQYINGCEKKYSIPKDGKRYLLIPEILYPCEFIVLRNDSVNTCKLYPVRKDVEGNDCTSDVSYNRHNSMADFFNTYKTKIYTSAVDKENYFSQFEFYPNPLNTFGILKGIVPQSVLKAEIVIAACNGQVLLRNQINERGLINLIVNRETFPASGIYFYKITLDGTSTSKKIIVLN
jgi:hypothetical protein